MEELKETKCKFCGTSKRPIYLMPRAEDKESYWCEECKEKKMGGE